MHREAKTPLLMLFGVTAMVLLIACANIANLLLARGASRSTEMGVRLALGGTRRNLVMQLLTESLVLAAARRHRFSDRGAVDAERHRHAAQAGGGAGDRAPGRLARGRSSPRCSAWRPGVVFGLFPALHSTRTDLISTIRAGRGQAPAAVARRRASAPALVTAQIALSMALLIMSALFLRSLVNVSHVDLGVKVDHVVTFEIVPQRTGYDSARSAHLFERVEQELSALPGVTGVSDAHGSAPRRRQLGEHVARAGLQVRSGRRLRWSLQRDRCRLLPHARRAAARRPRVHGCRPRGRDAGRHRQRGVHEEVRARQGRHRQVHRRRRQRLAQHPDRRRGAEREVQPGEGLGSAVYYRPWRQDTRLGSLTSTCAPPCDRSRSLARHSARR